MSLLSLCKRPVVKASPDQNVIAACRLLKENNVGCIVVEENDQLCGIITDRDIVLKVTAEGKDPHTTKIQDVMTPNPVRASTINSVQELTALMHAFHVRRVPVVNKANKTAGIITFDDVISLFGSEMYDLSKSVAGAVAERKKVAGSRPRSKRANQGRAKRQSEG